MSAQVCRSAQPLVRLTMPPSWAAAVNTGSIIKGLSLPCSPSRLLSANACICNVPEAALSPAATWIRCQPAVHGGALIWRQACCVPMWAAEKSDAPPTQLVSPTSSKSASSPPAHPGCGDQNAGLSSPLAEFSSCYYGWFFFFLINCSVDAPQKRRKLHLVSVCLK